MREYSIFKITSKRLKREVRIFVSLPKSYFNTEKLYPVLYMPDGQNLFDDKQATYGKSWGILEAYEKYPSIPELIIIGIDSDENRSDELTPFKFIFNDGEPEVGGRINDYLDFVVKTLKPHVDKKYRTFKSPKNTGIMGSSFGGVLATYAALKYSEYFTKFGCVSNAYFPFQKQFVELTKKTDIRNIKKLYMDVGTKETDDEKYRVSYIESNQEIFDILKEKIVPENIKFEIIKDGIHNEKDWEKRFPHIINFLFNV